MLQYCVVPPVTFFCMCIINETSVTWANLDFYFACNGIPNVGPIEHNLTYMLFWQSSTNNNIANSAYYSKNMYGESSESFILWNQFTFWKGQFVQCLLVYSICDITHTIWVNMSPSNSTFNIVCHLFSHNEIAVNHSGNLELVMKP